MKWVVARAALAALAALPLSTYGVQAKIVAQLAAPARVWVGQRLELVITLETDGLSFGSQRFRIPETDGGVLLRPDTNTLKGGEQRNGRYWQSLTYDLW